MQADTLLDVVRRIEARERDIRSAIYLMRDLQGQVLYADGWHYLKDAQEHLWQQVRLPDLTA